LGSARDTIYCELLVLRCKQGYEQAFEDMIGHWDKRLFYYVRRLVKTEEDAWDVLQHTWMEVFKRIGSLKDPQSLPTWLYRIARNTAYSHLRVKYREQAYLDESASTSEIEANDEISPFEDAQRVHHGLDQISLIHKEALTLFLLEDLSMGQMAEVLEIPLGTVKSRLHHAKRALRTVLQQEDKNHE
jgi:RNA polymerase sigma factor (sigma-70 family)